MTKEQYLQKLEKHLKRLPKEDFESAMEHFEEYFAEAGEEREQEVIKELGEPGEAAAELLLALMDAKGENTVDNVKSVSANRALLLFLGCVAAPIGTPLLLRALIGVFLMIILAVFFLVLLALYALMSLDSGGKYIIMGIGVLKHSVPAFCMMAGAGILEMGVAVCILFAELCICQWIIKKLEDTLLKMIRKSLEKCKRLKGGSNYEMD